MNGRKKKTVRKTTRRLIYERVYFAVFECNYKSFTARARDIWYLTRVHDTIIADRRSARGGATFSCARTLDVNRAFWSDRRKTVFWITVCGKIVNVSRLFRDVRIRIAVQCRNTKTISVFSRSRATVVVYNALINEYDFVIKLAV